MGSYAKNRPREQGFHVLQTGAEVGAGSARFFSVWEITRKIARVSKVSVFCRLGAEVGAGFARFFSVGEITRKNARVSKAFVFCRLGRR